MTLHCPTGGNLQKLVGQSQRWSTSFRRNDLSTGGASGRVRVTHAPAGPSTNVVCGRVSYPHVRTASHVLERYSGGLVVLRHAYQCTVLPVKSQISKGKLVQQRQRNVLGGLCI